MPTKQEDFVASIWYELSLTGSNQSIGYFTEVSGLSAEVEAMTYTEGGQNEFVHHLPTRVKHPNLVLKRGMTATDGLERWFRRSHTEAERVDIMLRMMDQDGTTLRTWSFASAFPIKWTGPTFSSTQSQAATETIEVVHEGLRVA
jgi:phage tail-like protein